MFVENSRCFTLDWRRWGQWISQHSLRWEIVNSKNLEVHKAATLKDNKTTVYWTCLVSLWYFIGRICTISHLIEALNGEHKTYFWSSHSLLSRGQTLRVFSQREIQWKWNACFMFLETTSGISITMKSAPTLHIPHAALHSSDVAETWLAWQSMPIQCHG